ncbi:DNA polymerase-3 subunit gamma/tau [Tumebacillus sp. BK434]|uniref:DNA polymerase III subunit gamma/tau n=1 Tax=Tumebacillus sp. BK434 TaxID=2512169 RepID=UPI0010519697|nr:DNA polymerase III subunit gamma/tau [Tumebacillus sp. BK434]TCP52647.1 DNA polymerase-3 subunit gamma/tau [Tumebacillus sp. BK434]
MAYIALYREWRPQLFRDIVGQEHVTRTLQNAIRQHRFAHAYLFNGPRGTGKTSAAKILSKAINCEQGPAEEPCNECHACKGITKGTIMDVMEIDAASNRGVDEIRDLRDKVKFAPTEVRYKVYIVDEVHMLTTEAFNALLKTLEEPPPHVMFILATTEPHKLPATIISRCQRFDFRRIMGRPIVDHLRSIAEQKSVEVEEEAYWMVARAAEGGMRDALSIFDQLISFGGDKVRASDIISMVGAIGTDVLARLAEGVAEHDAPKALGIIGELMDKGKDVGQLLHDIVTYFRDLLMYKTVPHLEEVRDRANYDRDFAEVAGKFEIPLLIQLIEQMTQVQNELKWQSQGRLLLEMLVVRLCQMQSFDPESLLKRIQELEAKIAGGLPAAPTGQMPQGQQPSPMQQIQMPPQTMQSAPPMPQGQLHQQPPQQQMQTPRPAPTPAPAAPQQQAAPAPAAAAPAPAPAPQGGMLSGGLDKIVTHPSPEALAHVRQFWPRVLDDVKARKITAQAWLLAGTPVAVDNGYIVVAFKSPIHKETVMKPIHREIIEPVFTQLMNGTPHQLYAVMETEWDKFQAHFQAGAASAAPEQPAAAEEEAKDALVEKAQALFGSEHLEVVE